MRPVIVLVLLAAAAFAQDSERRELVRVLGEDPFVPLARIGELPAREARERASGLAGRLAPDIRLRVLRVGLGSDKESVVFGALMLLDSEQLPLRELRNAAARATPRIGDADCPVTIVELKGAWGSRAVPAVIVRIPKLSAVDAD